MSGLVQQIRRCAVSIPSNIAERYGRRATNDYTRFLQISVGFLFELLTRLEISLNLQYIRKDAFDILFESTREVERTLVSLINKLQSAKKYSFFVSFFILRTLGTQALRTCFTTTPSNLQIRSPHSLKRRNGS